MKPDKESLYAYVFDEKQLIGYIHYSESPNSELYFVDLEGQNRSHERKWISSLLELYAPSNETIYVRYLKGDWVMYRKPISSGKDGPNLYGLYIKKHLLPPPLQVLDLMFS